MTLDQDYLYYPCPGLGGVNEDDIGLGDRGLGEG